MSTAMWRFHDAAMERAALIYTFARSTVEDTPAGSSVYSRQLPLLIDLVHEFCFSARKAIERAERYRPGTIQSLQALKLHPGEKELELSEFETPKTLPLTQESLWWVLGRIIHSKETFVAYRTLDIVVTNQKTGAHYAISQPVAFGFSSDRDSDRIDHYVGLERLATSYVSGVSYQIEEAIGARNHPARKRDDA